MLAAVTFFIALALLGAFIFFRVWEERRGIRLWSGIRISADETVSTLYRGAVTGSIPTHYRERLIAFLHSVTHQGVVFLVQALRAAERPLAQLSYRMRMHAPKGNDKDVSPFLKTISENRFSAAVEKTSEKIDKTS